MSTSDILRYTSTKRISTLTLNRPARHNALSAELITALDKAFERAVSDLATKVILLRAEGVSFCAGADVDDLHRTQQYTFEENLRHSNQLRALFQHIYNCHKPVVAQVQGAAMGGGCGLVAVCDFVLASEDACFACPEVRLGFVPAIIMQFLLRRIGEANTKALVLRGNSLSATQAQAIGLVNSVHHRDALTQDTTHLLQELVEKNSEQSMQLTKRLLYRLQQLPFEEGIKYGAEINASTRNSADCQLGVRRFLDKTPQDWSEK